MPFTMTHLIIADKVSNIFSSSLKNLSQFFWGNLAPDAVHFKANYVSDFKKASHLCTDAKVWGMVTDNKSWSDNVSNFLYSHRKSKNQDFILGYCSHLISDIHSNVALWMPFKEKYSYEIESGYGNLYHNETTKVDIELALTHPKMDVYRSYIQEAVCFDFEGIILAEELEKQKGYTLQQYEGKDRQDLSSNTIVTCESTMGFINGATDIVANIFRDYFAN